MSRPLDTISVSSRESEESDSDTSVQFVRAIEVSTSPNLSRQTGRSGSTAITTKIDTPWRSADVAPDSGPASRLGTLPIHAQSPRSNNRMDSLTSSSAPGAVSDSPKTKIQPSSTRSTMPRRDDGLHGIRAAPKFFQARSYGEPASSPAPPNINKCHRCREEGEDCTYQRPKCAICRREGFRCVYDYSDDRSQDSAADRLETTITSVKKSFEPSMSRNLPSEPALSDKEYDYPFESDKPSSSQSASGGSSQEDSESSHNVLQKPKPKPKTLEDVLYAYLGEDDDGAAQDMESDDTTSTQPVSPSDIEALLSQMKTELHAFQEQTVKASLRAQQYLCKTIARAEGRPTKGNPFDRLVPQQGPSKIRMLVKAKGATKWEPLSCPVSAIESTVASLPKSKSIGRVGPSLMSRNSMFLKYHPYAQEDEFVSSEDREKKYYEVSERYPNNASSMSQFWYEQRNCKEAMYRARPSTLNLMDRIGITPADVVYFFLHSPAEIEIKVKDIESAVLSTERVLSTQSCPCKTCHSTPKGDAEQRQLQLDKDYPTPTDEKLYKAAVAAHFFQAKFDISLWHVVSLDTAEASLVSADSQPEKEDAEQLCLVCGLHNCLVHGAFVEVHQLKGYEEAKTIDGPGRLDDPENDKNRKWDVATYATALQPDQHLCSVWCNAGNAKMNLEKFKGRQADGTISGYLSDTVVKVPPYLADDKLCSDSCFWNVSNRSEQPINFTVEQQEVFDAAAKNYSINPRGPCMLRDLLPKHTCSAIFTMLVRRAQQVAHPRDEEPDRRLAKGKSINRIDLSNNHLVGDRKAFFPCDHEGPCTEDNTECDCAKQRIACEPQCKCDGGCERRFKGCNCHMSPGQVCGDKHCACWNAGRECDPQLCKGCGVETVLHQAYKYKPEMRIGRCKNCYIQLDLPARTIKAPSEVQGYGLFAGQDLKKGDFIHEYKGEIVSRNESDRRGAVYSLSGQEYLFWLNAEQEIDANYFGNKSRFMNNSVKEANINVHGRTSLCRGQHRIGLFAKCDIKNGEELLYNYEYPEEVASSFWERGEKSAKNKAKINTPVAARARRGTKTQARQANKTKSKKTRPLAKDEDKNQAGTRKRRNGLQSGPRKPRSKQTSSGDVDVDDDEDDLMDWDADEDHSDYLVPGRNDTDSEDDEGEDDEDKRQDEVAETDSDVEMGDDEVQTPTVRRSASRGRGRGGRGRRGSRR